MTDRNDHPHITFDASAQTSGVCSVAAQESGQELHLLHEWAASATGLHTLLPASQSSAGHVWQQAVHVTWLQCLGAALAPTGAG